MVANFPHTHKKKVESSYYTLKLMLEDVRTNNFFFSLRHKRPRSQSALICRFVFLPSEKAAEFSEVSKGCAPVKTAKHWRPKSITKSQVKQEVRRRLKLLFAAAAGWIVGPSFGSSVSPETLPPSSSSYDEWTALKGRVLSNEGTAM